MVIRWSMTLHLSNYLSQWIYQVNIATSNILVHRNYDGDKMINDIALIKLAKPVDISGKYCYIKYTCT